METVSLNEEVEAFMNREISPREPDAWVDERSIIIGYSIDRIAHLGFGIDREVEILRQQYRNCRLSPLGRICTEVSRLPRIERNTLSDQTADVPGELIFFRDIKVIPDEQLVLAAYLRMFFSTDLGTKLLSELTKGMQVRRLNLRDLANLIVPVPTLEEQKELLEAKARIDQLAETLRRLESQLAANPENMERINSTVISALGELGQVTVADVIRGLVRIGESKRVEFKETFSLDVRKQSKEKYIEHSVLKTIVAFLNSDGGDLLVGVVDDGTMAGIEHEIDRLHRGSSDKFLLHLKNSLNGRIGAEFYPLLEQEIVKVGNVKILHVQCQSSSRPVFLDEEEFYVRTNPATDKLTGRKQADYINGRFE